jgi:hypothetical protein
VLALSLAALASGCQPKNTASIEPFSVCSMPDSCTFAAKCDAQFIGAPTLDVRGGEEMWLGIEVHNQLPDNANADTGATNTHDAHIESYSVGYSGSAGLLGAGTGDFPSIAVATQQSVPAAGTGVIGVYPFAQDLIDQLFASAAVPTNPSYVTVKATVKFKGRYDDGSAFEAPFDIPIRICRNCVSTACSDPTQVALSACPMLYQYPRGALSCNSPTCPATAGTYCGVNVSNGDLNSLYTCTTANSPPDSAQFCTKGCAPGTGSPDACIP